VTTTYAYDNLSRRTSVTSAGVTNAITGVTHTAQVLTGYDADGDVVRTEEKDLTGGDPSRVTTTDYDDLGRPSRVTDPEGATTSTGFDVFGNEIWMVDAAGTKYEYGYTARNMVAEVRLRAWHGQPVDPGAGGGDSDGGDSSSYPTLVLASYAYDLAGRRVRETDSMGRTTRYQYFGDGQVRKVVAHDVRDPFNPAAPKRDVVLQEFTYDAAGQVAKTVEPGGRVTAYEYDAAGRGTSETTDPTGLANRQEWTYGPGGDVVKSVRSGQSSNSTRLDLGTRQTIEYGYDVAGRQTSQSVTKSASEKLTTTYAYTESGLVKAVTAPRGNAPGAKPADFTTELGYDKLGRATTITLPAAPVETGGAPAKTVRPQAATSYDTFGEPTDERDQNGNLRTTAYDRAGRATRVAAADYRAPGAATSARPVTQRQYDVLGNVIAETDPLGAVTRYRYDQLNRVVERVDPDPDAADRPGGVWQYGYTTEGELSSVTDPTGSRIQGTYDDLGRVVTATQLERRPAPAAYTYKLRYDDAGNVLSRTSAAGDVTKYGYDVLGRPITTTDPAGIVSQAGYDNAGRQVRQSDGHGRTGYLAYDPAGRPTGFYSLSPDERILRKSSVAYDADGRQVSVTDATGRITKFSYDNRGLLTQQQEPVSATAAITTGFGYDAVGNRTRVTDGRGNATITTYNALGLAESVVEPATQAQPAAADRTRTTSYDLAGQPTALSAPGGVIRQRTFDALGRSTHETGTGAAAPTAERTQRFDLAGRLLAVNSPNGDKTFTYDDRGDLLTSTGPVSGTSTYAYDADGRLTQRADGAGTATFGYTQGRLTTQRDGLTGVAQTIGYDDAGKVAGIDYGQGRGHTYTYDDFGRLATDAVKGSGGASLASLAYSYDLDDRLTGKKTTGVAGAGDNTYGYDQAGRLTSWTSGAGTIGYEWDAAGNRTSAGGRTATFDERNRQLTDGTDTLAWSPRGTLESRTGSSGTVRSSFDAFDRLITQGGVSYGYDGLDRASTRDSQTFGYDGTSLDLTSDGSSTFARGVSGRLLAQRPGGGAAQLALTDRHSDVIGGLDPATGALTGSASYDPFGTKTGSSGATSALGFQSDYTDPASGSVDMGARWYSPSSGTFSRRDDVRLPSTPSAAANRYGYNGGDPLGGVDPDGHCGPATALCAGAPFGPPGWVIGALATAGVFLYIWINSDDLEEAFDDRQSGGGLAAAPPRIGYYADMTSDRSWNHSYRPLPLGSVKSGTAGGRGGHRGPIIHRPPMPPPPPPGIRARAEAQLKARTVADPIPGAALAPSIAGPVVSSSPTLPATVVASSTDDVQDENAVYEDAKKSVLDPNKPVVQDAADPVASELGVVSGVEAGAEDQLCGATCPDGDGYLYRGIPVYHYHYLDALQGRAVPRGGPKTLEEHVAADKHTDSDYTSWTHDYEDVAREAAEDESPEGGIVLRIREEDVPADRNFPTHKHPEVEVYPGEQEHTLKGVIDGAEISITRGPWYRPEPVDGDLEDPRPPHLRTPRWARGQGAE
jgi:RHS repeat-associated protein